MRLFLDDKKLSEPEKQAEAKRRYDAGERLCFSTGIDDQITYGYGALDQYGYWEFELRYGWLRPEHKRLVDQCDGRTTWS